VVNVAKAVDTAVGAKYGRGQQSEPRQTGCNRRRRSDEGVTDLLPSFRTKLSMISDEGKENRPGAPGNLGRPQTRDKEIPIHLTNVLDRSHHPDNHCE
jgi:hypothetical protein